MPADRKPDWNKWRHIPNVTLVQLVALSLDIDPHKVAINPHGWMKDTIIFDESQEFNNRLEIVKANVGNREQGLKITTLNTVDPLKTQVKLSLFYQFAMSVNWELPKEFPKQEIVTIDVELNKSHWLTQDAWSEAEFRDLLCGLIPENDRGSFADINNAAEAIRRGVLTGSLKAKEISDATQGDKFYAHNRFFIPAEAIRWATAAANRFPKFLFSAVDAKSIEPQAGINTQWPWGNHSTKLLQHLADAGEKFWSTYDPSDGKHAPKNETVEHWLKQQSVSTRVAQVMAQILRPDDLPRGPRK